MSESGKYGWPRGLTGALVAEYVGVSKSKFLTKVAASGSGCRAGCPPQAARRQVTGVEDGSLLLTTEDFPETGPRPRRRGG